VFTRPGCTSNLAAAGPKARKQLKLKVRRKRRHPPRYSCFKVRVTDQSGRPIKGARVRLGRKSKLTRANGRTTICRRHHARSRGRVKVSKPGYLSVGLKLRHR